MNFNFKLKKEHANLKGLIVQIINSSGLQIVKIIKMMNFIYLKLYMKTKMILIGLKMKLIVMKLIGVYRKFYRLITNI